MSKVEYDPVRGHSTALPRNRGLSPAIRCFAERTSIPCFFQVHPGDQHFERGAATVLPFRTFCRELGLP